MLTPKSIFLKFILCLLPFYTHGMELACDHSLHLSNQAKLEHEANLAYNHFLETNNLPKSNNHEMVLNNNLFLQCNENSRTAVAVFELNIINDLPPISLNEISKASEHFKVYECKNNDNVWSVMFDYSSLELLPSNREQAGYLLVAPLLEDMPLANESTNPAFLTEAQQQALTNNSQFSGNLDLNQKEALKSHLINNSLVQLFKIESADNTIRQNHESTNAINLINQILEKIQSSSEQEKLACSNELTCMIDQLWQLRDREGFAVGTLVKTETACKRIEEVQIGDMVAARNMKDDTQVMNRVVELFKEQIPTHFQLVLDNGTTNVAPDQKFYLPGTEECVTAYQLSKSPELQSAFPGMCSITEVKQPIDVYKLVVEDNHNFHVSEHNFLVHNFNNERQLFYSYNPFNHASSSRQNNSVTSRIECRPQVAHSEYFRPNLEVNHKSNSASLAPLPPEQQFVIGLNKLELETDTIRINFKAQRDSLFQMEPELHTLATICDSYQLGDNARLLQRLDLIKQSKNYNRLWHYQTQHYSLSDNAASLLNTLDRKSYLFKSCYGNPLQQHIHQDCIFLAEKASALTPESALFGHRESLIDLAESACMFNKVGETAKACDIVDFTNTLFIHAKAIGEGAAVGLLNVAQYAVDHPVETIATIVASKYVLAFQLGKLVGQLADIGVDMLINPATGQQKWNDFIAPLNQIKDICTGKTKLNSVDACKASACIFVSWKASGKLNQGLSKLFSGATTKALAFARNNPLATPKEYAATPEGMLFKFAHEPQKPQTIKDAILGTGQRLTKNELTLPKVKTYEQARNLALEIIGEVNPHTGKPIIGKQGVCVGKICGRQWHNKKVEMRLDHDPIKGAHINVTDWRIGKGKSGIDVAIPFEGDKELVISLLKHLQ